MKFRTHDERKSAVMAAYHNIANKGLTSCFKSRLPPEAILVATAMLAGRLAKEGGLSHDSASNFVNLHMGHVM